VEKDFYWTGIFYQVPTYGHLDFVVVILNILAPVILDSQGG
jgi:hypothetical protein